jgi:hypothetical protein
MLKSRGGLSSPWQRRAKWSSPLQEEVRLYLAVVFGSLLVVALRTIPAAVTRVSGFARRFGNIGLWILNLFLAAFLLPRQGLSGAHRRALSGCLPILPIADGAELCRRISAARPNAIRRASL